MEIPMLDEDEYAQANKLYLEGMRNVKFVKEEQLRFKALLDYYKNLTGFGETIPNAIMHHRIILYGPPCENCGKPYRTDKASFCAACGHKRNYDKGIDKQAAKRWGIFKLLAKYFIRKKED